MADSGGEGSGRVGIEALLERLRDEGVLEEGERRRAHRAVTERREGEVDDPWYVQAVAGAGAWIAAAFLVAFASCSNLVDLAGVDPFVTGVLFVAAGLFAHHFGDEQSVFVRQLSLACALLGEGLIVGGAWEQGTASTALAVYTPLVGVLYAVYPTSPHRFLSSFGLFTLAAATVEQAGVPAGYGVLFATCVTVVCVAFSEGRTLSVEAKRALRPMGYAAALSLIWCSSDLVQREFFDLVTVWPYRVVAGCGLVGLVHRAARHSDAPALEPTLWAAGGAGSLATLSTPGIMVALLLIFVGLWWRARSMLTLGVVAFAYHTAAFFYFAEVGFWGRVFGLVGSGAVLLGLRVWFGYRAPVPVEEVE